FLMIMIRYRRVSCATADRTCDERHRSSVPPSCWTDRRRTPTSGGTMIRARARAGLWLALLALVATACSGGGDDDTATEETAATEAGDGDATEEAGTDTTDAAAGDDAADDGAGAEVPDNPAEGVTADSIVLGWMGDVTGP